MSRVHVDVRIRGQRLSLGAVSGLALALVTLTACTANGGHSAPSEAAPSHAGVEAVSAPASATAPVALPGVSVSFDIDNPAAVTVVVTKLRPLSPANYAPDDLVFVGSVPGGGDQQLRAQPAAAMTSMYEAAVAAGAPFRISSAYRAYGFQQSLYSGYVSQFGPASADRASARPGFSEHQTGLAADVYDVEANRLKTSFAASAAGEWLATNAYAYGYIVSYPEGKEDVTGYKWEPWHVRYVGVEAANQMHDQDVVTLQEFMGVEASPGYE